MNVYSPMPGVADMNMVWMGAGQVNQEIPMELITPDHSDILMDHDNPFFNPSLHNLSNQSMDDIHSMHGNHMDGLDNLDMMQYVDMKNESNDSSYIEDENSQPVYMITTATQTLPCPTRKIKPIKHPGLVLKTPIAYQSNTDPSVIPIQKDGIAVCEKCGAMGVKHAFYTRERRFCSMACARGYSGLIPEPLPLSTQQQIPSDNDHFAKHRFTTFTSTGTSTIKLEDDFMDTIIDQDLPQLQQPQTPHALLTQSDETLLPLIRRKQYDLANSYDWAATINDQFFIAAPVTCFKHAPMSDTWENIMVGMKVEVENTDCDNVSDAFPDSFWVASVMKIVGYCAQLRYEGFGTNATKDFWVSLCSNQVHAVGWCATRGKPLIPPKTIEDKYSDWKDFLRKRLTGARTLPSNFSNKVSDSLKSRFQCGLHLEVVDKNRISQVKVAIVQKIVGKRLNVKYFDLPDDAGFWCHEDSPLLHPVGWAEKVGHRYVAPVNYLERVKHGIYDDDYATDELFNNYQVGTRDSQHLNGFSVGMKVEAIDPLNLSSICVATVMQVLRHGYIMIRIDTYESDANGADWFCYHIKSPCIFPVGFCEMNNIPLTPPKSYDQDTFNWKTYLNETETIAASPKLFNSFKPCHGFVDGMKIEAADLMDPRLVCVATIAKVAGRLLKVHFDGWEDEYDQWLDCESPDIYPVGWCQSVGHKLEGPRIVSTKNVQPINKLTKNMKKRGRKKKIKAELIISNKSSPDSLLAAITTVNTNNSMTTKLIKTEELDITTHNLLISENDIKLDINNDDNAGPETGQEPAGPDQNLPVSSDVNPPPERKATSYINATNTTSTKLIPRLIDNSGGSCEAGELCPEEWNVFDVAQFLRVNDCANYCDSFSKQKVDGKTMINLNKEDILLYTGCKVGPSLKIFDLIQQLKIKVNPLQSRHIKANIKKSL